MNNEITINQLKWVVITAQLLCFCFGIWFGISYERYRQKLENYKD